MWLARVLSQFASLCYGHGKLTKASELSRKSIEQLTLARQQSPHSARYANLLAWELAESPDPALRDTSRAVELAEFAVDRAPLAAFYWNTLGVARFRNDDSEAAIVALKKSILLSEESAYDAFYLAMAYAQAGQKQLAQQWFDKGVKLKSDDPLFSGNALALVEKEAKAMLDKAVKLEVAK